MQKLDKLYEGKAKKLYATDDPDVLWVEYMNQATAGNGAKKAQIEGKGELNNQHHLRHLRPAQGARHRLPLRQAASPTTEQLVQARWTCTRSRSSCATRRPVPSPRGTVSRKAPRSTSRSWNSA
ncbi:MAG: phosphoribosylaminoimidazolesuccinocarboxamide synthase [Bifidobacterium pullorum]